MSGSKKYIEELDCSVGTLNAKQAWRCALLLAKSLETPIYVKFRWNDPKQAPSKFGLVRWSP